MKRFHIWLWLKLAPKEWRCISCGNACLGYREFFQGSDFHKVCLKCGRDADLKIEAFRKDDKNCQSA